VARPFPDYARLSHREYGHRVGIFRVLDVLKRHGIKATVALDAMTAENYPYLVRHLLGWGCEIIGHGVSVSRMINSGMSQEQEREYISESLKALTTATGSAPQGWLGPEYGESARTPQLLAEAGISYVCDWANDEQPYPLNVPQGEILALPIMLELDDVNAMADRKVDMCIPGSLASPSASESWTKPWATWFAGKAFGPRREGRSPTGTAATRRWGDGGDDIFALSPPPLARRYHRSDSAIRITGRLGGITLSAEPSPGRHLC